MMNMAKADLYRIFRGINIYLAFGIVILMASISIGTREVGHIGNASADYNGESIMATGDADSGSKMPHTTRTDEQKKNFAVDILASNINLYYPIILLVYAVLMADFSNHTIKNTLSAAVSKTKYYQNKLALILLLSTALIFFNTAFVYLLNFIINGRAYSGAFGRLLVVTVKQLPMLWGITSLMVLFGFLTKKAAAFNAVVIPFQILFQVLVNVLFVITKWKPVGTFLYHYELQSALSELASSTDGSYIMTCACIGFAEVAVSIVAGCQIFKKTEIR